MHEAEKYCDVRRVVHLLHVLGGLGSKGQARDILTSLINHAKLFVLMTLGSSLSVLNFTQAALDDNLLP